jgi:uncharacterized membrane protein
VSFWLSHHPPEQYDHTYRFGSVHVCARCLGVYPMLALGLTLQLAARAPLAWKGDVVGVLALTAPALIDWALGRLRLTRGSNAVRTATGVLLGLALARSLYIHFQRPFPEVLLAQAVSVTAVVIPVIFLAYLRRGSDRPDRDVGR